jgi:large subunit ribosomal protein L24
VRKSFVSATLSKALRERFGKRSIPLRKGDEIEVMRGTFKGQRGVVDRVDLSKTKIYVDEIKIKKSDGSEVMRALQPSNLRIVKLNLDDKKRQMVFDRVSKTETKKKEPKKKAEVKKEKPIEKIETKKEKKPEKKPPKKAPKATKTKKPAPKKAPAKKKTAPKKPAKKAAPAKKKGGKNR